MGKLNNNLFLFSPPTLGEIFSVKKILWLELCFKKVIGAWNVEQNEPLNVSNLYLDIADYSS